MTLKLSYCVYDGKDSRGASGFGSVLITSAVKEVRVHVYFLKDFQGVTSVFFCVHYILQSVQKIKPHSRNSYSVLLMFALQVLNCV